MPELPEVETVVRALRRALTSRKIRGAALYGRLRTPFDASAVDAALAGRTCTGVRRRGKYIIFDFPCRHALVAHLGMTGYFHLEKASSPLHPHDRVGLRLDKGDEMRFADARRFGFIDLVETADPGGDVPTLSHLGLEPLERECNAARMADLAVGRKVPVKVFLMNQEVVVGVGNIYASEALHAACVDPRRMAGDITAAEWKRVVAKVKAVLRAAIRAGGSTIRNYRGVNGDEGKFQRALRVYGKAGEPCPACGGVIETVRLGGRSTFYCAACQH
ncbi:MAG: bifunctional DNA-formamidopyrimidine glycosylase/DNA-(apurinic or apyrimidinic site) lyase [Planctomycetaceae bacterium]|nr:bifunctional DNA-formamidopyrimidine glycosylase/DNA-(apurinic or apyrimidinic site) lyase [Planctomycetaceae bacterium]